MTTAKNDPRPRVAVTLGDCAGIGPEIVAKVLAAGTVDEVARVVVVGDVRVLEMGMRDGGVKFPYQAVKDAAKIDWTGALPVVDLGNIDPATVGRATVSKASGKAVGETLLEAVRMTQRGQADGVVFASLNKRAMYDGGWRYPDEHKMFAELLEHKGYFSEMNVLDNQWMSRVTGHMSLREALDHITPDAIRDAIVLSDTMMRRAGIANPRIAVNALNPHGGENGLFGREEIEIIRPVVEEMKARGINCSGPYPADTVYIRAFGGEFDGVVSMYHDQGQIANKLHGFHRGVTVTGGLATVFTTPAHGVAFDIAGKGVAKTGALENAIRLNARLATAALTEKAKA